MDLQSFIAINLMALSLSAIGLAFIYKRVKGNETWLAVHALVLAVGALAFWLVPHAVGTWMALVFVPLVVAPRVLMRLAQRDSIGGRQGTAARYARLNYWLHPSPANKINAELFEGLAQADNGDARALTKLANEVPPQYRPLVQVQAARLRSDWSEVLALSDQAPEAPEMMRPLQVRALGELDRRADMVRAFTSCERQLSGVSHALASLCVLAFSGRIQGVQALLKSSMAKLPEDTKTYWLAVAHLKGSTDRAQAEQALRHLVDKSEKETTRVAARRQLLAAAAGPPDALPYDVEANLDLLERRTVLQSEPREKSSFACPVTAALIIANVIMFALELFMGGSEDGETLVRLGALWLPQVMQAGEWWRLVTACFLHFGPLHLVINMFVLWTLGRLMEPLMGRWVFAGIYAIGGIGSSACVLWMMVKGYLGYEFLVGASGAIFALVGAEAALLLTAWRRDRKNFDKRQLTSLAMMLGLQLAIDLSLPNVSMAAHMSGFSIGLATTLLWFAIAPRLPRPNSPTGITS